MANKRTLKKALNQLTSDLAGECFAYAWFHENADAEKINKTLWAIGHTSNELISRINRGIVEKSPKAVKAHYQAIIRDAQKLPDLLKFE